MYNCCCSDLVLAASIGIALGAVTGALMMVALLVVKRKYVLLAASMSYKLCAVYTVSQKKLCQLIFCSFTVKYELISIKIGRIVPEETLHKTVPRMPTSPKVCACTTLGNLKCQIEPSAQ